MIEYLYMLPTHHHNKSSQHLSLYILTECFCVMKTFKIYFPSKIQVRNTVLLTTVTVLYIRACMGHTAP